VKFSQTDDHSATSDLAHVLAMYDTYPHAKLRGHTSYHLEVIGGCNCQI